MARKLWNFTPSLPLQLAPYYDWPLKPLASLRYLLNSWKPLGVRLFLLLVAVLIYFTAMPDLESAKAFSLDWMAFVWARNLVILLVVAGGLHLALWVFKIQGDEERYDMRPMAKGARTFFFKDQVKDNIFLSVGPSLLFWSLYECLIWWGFANGYITMITQAENPVYFALLILVIPIYAGLYFYWHHRALHTPFLYRHVHSWHNKNVNTGPWSGLAMHPAEQLILFSDVLIFFLIPSHPVLVLFIMFHHGIGAPTSHAGFERLKLSKKAGIEVGDFFHQLHHRFVDCNFGTYETPWDRWFGTFHDGTDAGNQAMYEKRKAARSEA